MRCISACASSARHPTASPKPRTCSSSRHATRNRRKPRRSRRAPASEAAVVTANDGMETGDGTAALTAGGMLRHARESAGWSIDMVSQQLKLAPRQVQALEADDYAQLPGRTFVRGFMRNYARLLRLDADALLSALPESA